MSSNDGGYRIRGVVHRPDPAEIERLRARLDEEVGAAAQGVQQTHGLSIPYLAAVATAWSTCTRSALVVTVDGRAIEVDDEGHFTLDTAGPAAELVASVGPGLSTGLRVPAASQPAAFRGALPIAALAVVVVAAGFLIRHKAGSRVDGMPFLLVVPLLAMPLSAAQVASPVDAALATLAAALEGDDQTSVRSAFSPDYRPPPGRTAEEARTAWAEALRGVSGRRVQMSADRVETGPSSCGGAIVATSRWTVVGSYKDQVFGRAEQTVFSFAQQGGRLVVVSTSRVPAPP